MATARKKVTTKEKAMAGKVLQAAASNLVCKPMTCKITDPTCTKLAKCVITCKIKKA